MHVLLETEIHKSLIEAELFALADSLVLIELFLGTHGVCNEEENKDSCGVS